ncbi:tRNA1(Val) (adenine(37)-N6)-methyltransferase [Helicobacter sp. 23-1045]
MDKAVLSLYQLQNGYCYNSDSLFLYAFIARFLKNGVSVVDIGAGCGILGLLCGRDFGVNLTMIDIDSRNAKLCKKNADFNHISANIFCENAIEIFGRESSVDLTKSRIDSPNQNSLQNLSKKKFDFIISNPPFYDRFSPPPRKNHLFLAKKSENLPFESLTKIAKTALNKNGKFIFCYKSSALADIFSALQKNGFNVSALQFVYPKKNARIESKKNATLAMISADFSKKYLEVLPPIFNFVDTEHSAEAREIFAFCKTKSIKINESDL